MKAPLGVLNLHGFTSSLDCVNGLNPYIEALGLPYRMPVLRGHMQTPEALIGVTWRDWYADAEAALKDLLTEAEKAVVVGLSMGGLVALHLAAEHPDQVDAIALVAAALKLRNPLAPGNALAFLQPIVGKLVRWWPMPPNYADKELEKYDTNYDRAPMDAILSFLDYTTYVEGRLPEVRAPALIIQSHKDQTVAPNSAQIIHDRIASTDKRIVWFERSHHEMMRDLEREKVFETIQAFLKERLAKVKA
ncbi:MAG: alpha/beta fold hydrolase [Chloroflexi bacterium]|nr:alpha/beta fold hydrolase [Chloroflexota bacterium]